MEPKSIKHRSKFKFQDGVPLGIDFSSIWGCFGRQVRRHNRTKIDQKSIQKGTENILKQKTCVLDAPGMGAKARHGGGWILGPLINSPHRKPHTTNPKSQKQSHTRLAQNRGGGYCIYMSFYIEGKSCSG